MDIITSESAKGEFKTICLSNGRISVQVVPELGAKIVSLQNLVSGREWCWHPGPTPNLFKNTYGAPFGDGPHTGIDECFPTIEACKFQGRHLPCHGEVWTEPWSIEGEDNDDPAITTLISLRESPLTLRRRLAINASTLSLEYTVRNIGRTSELFVWALHPLFKVIPGDRLILPKEVKQIKVETSQAFPPNTGVVPWPNPFAGFDLDRLELGENLNGRIKAFTPLLKEGQAEIKNLDTLDALKMSWDTIHNPYLGVWITRGGYCDIQDVVALEPTNAQTDSLEVFAKSASTVLESNEERRWRVNITLS